MRNRFEAIPETTNCLDEIDSFLAKVSVDGCPEREKVLGPETIILVDANPADLVPTVKVPTDANTFDPLDSIEEMPVNVKCLVAANIVLDAVVATRLTSYPVRLNVEADTVIVRIVARRLAIPVSVKEPVAQAVLLHDTSVAETPVRAKEAREAVTL